MRLFKFFNGYKSLPQVDTSNLDNDIELNASLFDPDLILARDFDEIPLERELTRIEREQLAAQKVAEETKTTSLPSQSAQQSKKRYHVLYPSPTVFPSLETHVDDNGHTIHSESGADLTTMKWYRANEQFFQCKLSVYPLPVTPQITEAKHKIK